MSNKPVSYLPNLRRAFETNKVIGEVRIVSYQLAGGSFEAIDLGESIAKEVMQQNVFEWTRPCVPKFLATRKYSKCYLALAHTRSRRLYDESIDEDRAALHNSMTNGQDLSLNVDSEPICSKSLILVRARPRDVLGIGDDFPLFIALFSTRHDWYLRGSTGHWSQDSPRQNCTVVAGPIR